MFTETAYQNDGDYGNGSDDTTYEQDGSPRRVYIGVGSGGVVAGGVVLSNECKKLCWNLL